jgi:hypothetical protein
MSGLSQRRAIPRRPKETALQAVLRGCIERLVQVPGVFDHDGDAEHGLVDYITRHALAADAYLVSSAGSRVVAGQRHAYPRNRLPRKAARYDVTVPPRTVLHALRDSVRSPEAIGRILARANYTALISRDEDLRLRKAGLAARMPTRWRYATGDPLARYAAANIRIVGTLEMRGPIVV